MNTSPTTNNGTSSVMWVGESNNATNKVARSLIKFDLSSIPSNATITSATLSLWTDADFSDNDRLIKVYRLKVPFNETEATWNESASGVNWHGVGASGSNDRESTDIGSVLIPADQAIDVEKQISLTPAKIQEMINGTFTNNGFAIVADTETDDRFNYKTSDATASTKRPKLVIQYTLPQGHLPSHNLASTLPRSGGGQGGGHFVNYIMPKALLQSGSLTFTPADDAHIFNANPSNNYGSATTLQVDDSPVKHFLLKFDVTGVSSQTVTNAKLCLYNVDGASAGGDFHHVSDDSWQEETVTWSNAPTADTQVLASLGSVSANTWYEVNLTSHITGDGTYSLRISDSTGGADYSSKEGANAPKLLIALGSATPQSCSTTATATPTNTPTPGPSPTPTNTSAPTSTPTATQPPQGAFNSATFVYDGDGNRVKSTFNSTTTTYFVGNHYEVTGSTITKYYYAGAQRIAMRTNGTLNFLLGDHLGSSSLTTNATGQIVSELRYKAWGETRYASGTTQTKYQYTGQYSYVSDFGLHFYNARWYDSSLGRFAQADSIVPGGVQGLDRYAYVNNNPLKYVDPSGHTNLCTGYWNSGCTFGHNITDEERKDHLFTRVFSGSGNNGQWTGEDWAKFQEDRNAYYDKPWKWTEQEEKDFGWNDFADAVDNLSKYYDKQKKDLFVRDFALLFGGIPASTTVPEAVAAVAGGPGLFLNMGLGGLPSQYLDTYNRSDNQSHHYAGIFFLGYFIGRDAGIVGNTGRDLLDKHYRPEPNWGDIRLGNVAANNALQFKVDLLLTSDLSNLADYIRRVGE